ncbi:major facilitator superfamily domain-containing protein 6-like protein A isoform X1 [Huso huso]|uniref:Major facilitator superfamily domain-containing protein 6-like protein A isoform X1 n=1 Tax=Huso huso TaxID=61971 RepID=A0ABR0Z0M6_HUSHU
MRRNKQWDVNKAMLLSRLFQFLHCAGKACVIPFLTLYLRYLGLTASLTGIIMGTKHFINLAWAPLSGYFAKHYNKRRVVILSSLLCSIGAGLLLLLIPPADKATMSRYCNISAFAGFGLPKTAEDTINYSQLGNTTMTVHAFTTLISPTALSKMNTKHIATAGAGQMLNDAILATAAASKHEVKRIAHRQSHRENHKNEEGANPDIPDNSDSKRSVRSRSLKTGSAHGQKATDVVLEVQHQLFFLVLMAVALWEVLAAPLEWTVDDGLYEYLDFVDATDGYSQHWIWGYLGAACSACGMGLLVSNLDCLLNVHIHRSSVHFYCYAILITLTLLTGTFLPIHVNRKREQANKVLKALHLISNDGRATLCALTAFIVGAVGSTVENYLFWQMQDKGSSEFYMGASIAIKLFAEILLSFFSSKILKTLGQSGTVALGMLCMAVQCLYYSFLWSPWSVLPIQSLNAFSNGALWWALNAYCEDVSTPGMERSVQRVFQALSLGLGAGIGSLAGGFIASRFSLEVLYRAAAVVLVIWSVAFLLVQSRIPRQKKVNYSQLLAADNSDLSDTETDQERDWLVKAMKDEIENNSW